MFENVTYKFQNRNSKKNLKKQVEKLNKALDDLRHETIGYNRNGWINFGHTEKDTSLYQKYEDICEYLGIDYSEKKLVPKPKEDIEPKDTYGTKTIKV